jgi:hypothetical protein
VLLEGLETGDADINNDGCITVDELFGYIEKQLKVKGSRQHPNRWLFNAKEGELLFALNIRAAQRRCSHKRLGGLAQEYVRLRKETESGSERTQMMARLMWSMRNELGKAAPTEIEVKQWLTGSDGDRLVGLAAVQVNPKATFGTEVFSMIAKRHTRFEQYQAVNSAYDMLPTLDFARIKELEMSIAKAIGTSITDEDSSRWDLAHRLLKDVRKRAKIFA